MKIRIIPILVSISLFLTQITVSKAVALATLNVNDRVDYSKPCKKDAADVNNATQKVSLFGVIGQMIMEAPYPAVVIGLFVIQSPLILLFALFTTASYYLEKFFASENAASMGLAKNIVHVLNWFSWGLISKIKIWQPIIKFYGSLGKEKPDKLSESSDVKPELSKVKVEDDNSYAIKKANSEEPVLTQLKHVTNQMKQAAERTISEIEPNLVKTKNKLRSLADHKIKFVLKYLWGKMPGRAPKLDEIQVPREVKDFLFKNNDVAGDIADLLTLVIVNKSNISDLVAGITQFKNSIDKNNLLQKKVKRVGLMDLFKQLVIHNEVKSVKTIITKLKSELGTIVKDRQLCDQIGNLLYNLAEDEKFILSISNKNIDTKSVEKIADKLGYKGAGKKLIEWLNINPTFVSQFLGAMF